MNLPYVASLCPVYHEDLLSIPICSYWKVQVKGKELLCYRTKKVIGDKERTVVLYVSERLRQGQMRGLKQALSIKYEKLQQLKNSLRSPRGKKRKKEALERKIQDILKGEKTDLLVDVSIQENGGGRFDIDWQIDPLAYRWVTGTLFGKRILVSSRDEWNEEEIIAAYQGQSHIERVFKHFKNPYHHAVRPQYHWTDQEIKVHTFICLIGLLISQILWKKACELGYSWSLEGLIGKLADIRKSLIIAITDLKGKPQREVRLEEMEPEIEKLYQALSGNTI